MSNTVNKESNQKSKPTWFKRIYEKIPIEYRKAFWLTLYSFAGIVVIIFFFIVVLRFVSPSIYDSVEHFIENNELVWVAGMGMLGIFFAVRAMYEAGNALTKSTEILTAISSFFDNYDQAAERIDKLISEAKNELLILVSLPAFGVIVKNPYLGEVFKNQLLKRFPDSNKDGLKIQFMCFTQDLCTKYEDNIKIKDVVTFNKYMIYKQMILEGIHNVRKLQRQTDATYENIWLLGMDTHIRLFIADDSKAIFATVPDFKPDNLESEIAGFETTEKKMVQILKKLFEEQKRSGSPMSEPDFGTFKFS